MNELMNAFVLQCSTARCDADETGDDDDDDDDDAEDASSHRVYVVVRISVVHVET